ncbi:SET domain-containing protein SmydA-8-like [Homarus americanus]|nr:SET domain-containing protein SmydA-8-like [Homarus americanus]XP_042221388.1 SET domain-containing protein SmydA-8-like [Homarus americanus]XP_042221390.1 SET domain-containing protein SmydA-8-like [Homarus americanus]
MGGGDIGTCGVCHTVASLTCGGCGSMHYCGKEHQRQHWPKHRVECPPYKVVSTPEAGKHMVASRKLTAGQMLVYESPVVVAPLSICPLLCLGCHGSITGDDFPRCPKCWWPLCSLACASSRLHKGECAILALDTKHIAPPTEQGETPRYDVIAPIRCLLLQSTNPSGWQTILDMAHHSEQRQLNKEEQHLITVRYLSDVLKLDYDLDILNQARGAVATNGMEIRSDKNTRVRAMYPLIRLFNNSCAPNVHLSVAYNGMIQARTTVPVSVGEPLCICYTGALMPIWERNETLTLSYHFSCNCPRCGDPTELGTHFSSPRCPDCVQSYLLPCTWLGETVWRCKLCKQEESNAQVLENVKIWLQRIEMDDIFSGCSLKRSKAALQEVEDDFHPQHYVWMRAAHSALYRMSDNNTEQGLNMRIKIWKRLVALYTVLEPGLTKRRGMSLLETGIIMLRAAQLEHREGEPFMPELLERVRTVVKYLDEASQILSMEPTESKGPAMVQKTEEVKAEAEQFLQRLDSETVRAE